MDRDRIRFVRGRLPPKCSILRHADLLKPRGPVRNSSRRFLQQRAKPSWIISHELALDEVPNAYKHFDCREKGWTKVILHLAQSKKTAHHRTTHKRAVKPEAALAE
jgi:hypothetical protein